MRTPERFLKIFHSGTYTVTVSFQIDKQGAVQDLYLRKSVEWSADSEVFSIFQKSPLWIPATQNGKPVLYRQVQDISFNIIQNSQFFGVLANGITSRMFVMPVTN